MAPRRQLRVGVLRIVDHQVTITDELHNGVVGGPEAGGSGSGARRAVAAHGRACSWSTDKLNRTVGC